jgi:hypothetical protein
MTFFVSAPIFVFREFMRHRIASYNEESGRYRELKPVFYIPSAERKLIQVGKTGAYTFVDGTKEQFDVTVSAMKDAYVVAYESYQKMLEAGVARETISQQAAHAAVDFACDYSAAAREQFVGQHAGAGAYFQHGLAGLHARCVDQFAQHVLINEKILAKRFEWRHATRGQKLFDGRNGLLHGRRHGTR